MAVVTCPSCGQELTVADDQVDGDFRCPQCAGTFTAGAPSPAAPPRPRSDDRSDDDDRPRRSSVGAGVPHRGGMVMAFGLISLILFFTSIGALIGLGPFGLPVTIIGLVLGILAWKWGGEDIKKMKAGQMDERGLSNTQTGYYCGIVGTVLHIFGLLCGCGIIIITIGLFGLAFTAASAVPSTTYAAPRPAGAPRPADGPARPRQSFNVPLPRLADYLPRATTTLR